MSGLVIGPGLDQWCKDHNATPLGNEVYDPPDYEISSLPILIANSAGQQVVTQIGWHKTMGLIIPPGPGIVVTPSPVPPGQQILGIDMGFPTNAQDVIATISATGAQWVGCYIGGEDYIGTWTASMAREVQASTEILGFVPIFVPRQATMSQSTGLTDLQDIADLLNGPWAFTTQAGNIFVDVEQNTWAANPSGVIAYMNTIASQLDAVLPNWDPGVYGPKPCVDIFKPDPAMGTWLASWDGLSQVEGYDIHQYRGSAGTDFDLDVAILREPAFELSRF